MITTIREPECNRIRVDILLGVYLREPIDNNGNHWSTISIVKE